MKCEHRPHFVPLVCPVLVDAYPPPSQDSKFATDVIGTLRIGEHMKQGCFN